MQVTGTIIEILEPSTIASANGDIKMQQFIIETNEDHPNKIFFTAFGEKRIEKMNLTLNTTVCVAFEIKAREYNGRWYNSIVALSAEQVLL